MAENPSFAKVSVRSCSLSQPASQPCFGWPLQILDNPLKKTAFEQLFIILTAFGLLINIVMASEEYPLGSPIYVSGLFGYIQ